MKLSLSEIKGIQILKSAGPVTHHDFDVLSAGMVKFLKFGKHKIVLEFNGAEDLDEAMLKKLNTLDKTAKELSGGIMIVTDNDALATKLKGYSTLMPFTVFRNPDKALEAFVPAAEMVEAKAAAAAPTVIDVGSQVEEIKQLKDQLAKSQSGELKTLRAENAQMKSQVTQLEEALSKLVLKRQDPLDDKGYNEKLKLYEDKIETLMKQIEEAQTKGSAAPK